MRFIAALALWLLALPAGAQTTRPTEPEAQVLPRLISSLCIDLVEARNGCETAVLLTSESQPDTADLLIFSDRRAQAPQKILIAIRGIAFNGPIFGQSPWLEQAGNGSLQLHEEQVGMGRMPWASVLTITHRDGDFIVAGRRYSTYDRILAGYFSCDVNLLTGDWTAEAERPHFDESILEPAYDNARSGRIAGVRHLLADWSNASALPAPCETAIADWMAAEPD